MKIVLSLFTSLSQCLLLYPMTLISGISHHLHWDKLYLVIISLTLWLWKFWDNAKFFFFFLFVPKNILWSDFCNLYILLLFVKANSRPFSLLSFVLSHYLQHVKKLFDFWSCFARLILSSSLNLWYFIHELCV